MSGEKALNFLEKRVSLMDPSSFICLFLFHFLFFPIFLIVLYFIFFFKLAADDVSYA